MYIVFYLEESFLSSCKKIHVIAIPKTATFFINLLYLASHVMHFVGINFMV